MSEALSYFSFNSSRMLLNCSRADWRFSAISAAKTSGAERLSVSSRLSFLNQNAAFQHGIQTIDMLVSRKPNWEEIKLMESLLISLEKFMHFQAINWEYKPT